MMIKIYSLKYLLLIVLGVTLLLTTIEPVNATPSYQDDDSVALIEQGDIYFWQSNFSEAETAYTNAVTADPTNAEAYVRLCYLRTFEQRYDEAIAHCQQTVSLTPDEAEGYIYLTKAYDWGGDPDAAIEVGEKAIVLAPQNGLAHSFLGEAYLDAGDLEAAETALRRGVELAPEEPEIHRNLAYLYVSLNDIKAQFIEFEEAISLAPNFAYYHTEAALYYRRQSRYLESLTHFEQALTISREVGNPSMAAMALLLMGSLYEDLARYEEALMVLEQALDIYRDLGNRGAESSTLNNIGLAYSNQGRNEEAMTAYEQSLVIDRELGNKGSKGTTLVNIASVYEVQGRYEEALTALGQALTIFREVGNRTREGTTRLNIGAVYTTQGRYEEAFTALEQALVISRELGSRNGEGTALNNIGVLYFEQSRYQEALTAFQQALAIFREVGDRHDEGNALVNIGAVYREQRYYEKALMFLEQALAVIREVEDPYAEGIILDHIANVYFNQGRYDQGLNYLQQALTIYRELDSRNREGQALISLARLYEIQGRFEQALDSLQQALTIHRETGDRKSEASTLEGIGTVYLAQDDYGEALDYLQQSLSIDRELDLPLGVDFNNLGLAYSKQGQFEEALDYYQQALAVHQEKGDQQEMGTTLRNIGMVYTKQGQHQKALDNFLKAMDAIEAVWTTTGSELARSSFMEKNMNVYAKTFVLFYQLNQTQEAFLISERSRSRGFLDSLATERVQLNDVPGANLLAKEQELYARRQAIQNNLSKARSLNPPNPDLVANLEVQLAEVEAAFVETQQAIAAYGVELALLAPGHSTDTVLGVEQVQPLLDEQTTLVSYYMLEDKIVAFILSDNNFETIALEAAPTDVAQQITAFRDFANVTAVHPTSAMTLYDMLIVPVKSYLNTPHLAIIPHSVLHYLPFAALTDGERYLIDDYTLTVLPSASSLPFIQENTNPSALSLQPSALVVGNPTTADYDTVASLATTRNSLGSLPFAEQEAKTIGELFGVEPLIGEAATESTVRERVGEANILHLAAHGQFNPIAPLNSLIALAPDETNDGWLTVGESYGLNLENTNLVVLSACETNLGDLNEGDELVGLTRALIFAGTPSVIASLWAVEDEATSLLMERFYTHLRDGIGKAKALRQAQIEVRAEYPNPYYWSGFVLSGDPGEIGSESMEAEESEAGVSGDDNRAVVEVEATVEADAPATTAPVETAESQPNGNCLSLLVIIGALGTVGVVRRQKG